MESKQFPEADADIDTSQKTLEQPAIDTTPVEPSLQQAQKLKQDGNTFFKANQYHDAIQQYRNGLRYCPEDQKKLLSVLNSNISVAYMKLQDYKMVYKYTAKAVEHDPTYRKAWLNQGKAYEEDDKPDEALEAYTKALELEREPVLAEKVAVLKKKVDALNQKRKEEVMSGLKNIGNSILGYFGMSLDNFQMQQNPTGGYSVSFKQ